MKIILRRAINQPKISFVLLSEYEKKKYKDILKKKILDLVTKGDQSSTIFL